MPPMRAEVINGGFEPFDVPVRFDTDVDQTSSRVFPGGRVTERCRSWKIRL